MGTVRYLQVIWATISNHKGYLAHHTMLNSVQILVNCAPYTLEDWVGSNGRCEPSSVRYHRYIRDRRQVLRGNFSAAAVESTLADMARVLIRNRLLQPHIVSTSMALVGGPGASILGTITIA